VSRTGNILEELQKFIKESRADLVLISRKASPAGLEDIDVSVLEVE